MTNTEKAELLKDKLSVLTYYRTKLTDANLEYFNMLKKDILALLDDNQKLKFNQINFYDKTQDYSKFDVDDLPF